jgi:hypothetical protein
VLLGSGFDTPAAIKRKREQDRCPRFATVRTATPGSRAVCTCTPVSARCDRVPPLSTQRPRANERPRVDVPSRRVRRTVANVFSKNLARYWFAARHSDVFTSIQSLRVPDP